MNKELIARIEALETLTQRLEQAILEIRNSCPCVGFPEPEESIPNCEPFMEEPEELEIPNCEPPYSECGQEDCWCNREIEKAEEEVDYE